MGGAWRAQALSCVHAAPSGDFFFVYVCSCRRMSVLYVGTSRMGVVRVSFAVLRLDVTPISNVLRSTTRACNSIPLLLCATRYSLCPGWIKRVIQNRAEEVRVQLGHVRSIFPVSIYVLVATLVVDCRVVGIKSSVLNYLRSSPRVISSCADHDPLPAHPENRSTACL